MAEAKPVSSLRELVLEKVFLLVSDNSPRLSEEQPDRSHPSPRGPLLTVTVNGAFPEHVRALALSLSEDGSQRQRLAR